MIKFAKRGNAPEEVITDLGEMFKKLYYDEGGRFIIENEYDANVLNYICMFNHYDDLVPGYFDKPGTYKYNHKGNCGWELKKEA